MLNLARITKRPPRRGPSRRTITILLEFEHVNTQLRDNNTRLPTDSEKMNGEDYSGQFSDSDDEVHLNIDYLHRVDTAIGAEQLLAGDDAAPIDSSNESSALWTAVCEGRADIVDRLLQRGANTQNSQRTETLLQAAVTRGHQDVVDVLLLHEGRQMAAGIPLDGETALHHVTDPQEAAQLLQGSIDVNALSWSFGTPLHEASKCGRAKVVQTLLRFGADVNRRDAAGDSVPLHRVADDLQLVGCLLEHGADINAQDESAFVPLQSLADRLRRWENPDTVLKRIKTFDVYRRLVEYGARLDRQNARGQTALHVAVQNGWTEVVTFLLSREVRLVEVGDGDGNLPVHNIHDMNNLETMTGCARLDVVNNAGISPLCTFLRNFNLVGDNDLALIKAMIAVCPSLVTMSDHLGNTALHYVAIHHKYDGCKAYPCVYQLIKLLVNNGCDINIRNTSGQTPIQFCRNVENMAALLELGARSDISDNLGRSLVHHLAIDPDFEFQSLATVDDRMSAEDSDGYDSKEENTFNDMMKSVDKYQMDCWSRTALHYVALSSDYHLQTNLDMIFNLYFPETSTSFAGSGNAIVNSRDSFGRTTLHYAAFMGNVDYLERLIEYGGDMEVKDDDGAKPADLQVATKSECEKASRRHAASSTLLALRHRTKGQNWSTFQQMYHIDKLRPCIDDCSHHSLTLTTPESQTSLESLIMEDESQLPECQEDGEFQENALPCLYRLRPERNSKDYVAKLWKELDYACRNPLTPYVHQKVIQFMERLTTAVGHKDQRFGGVLVHVGSSFEGTKIGDPDEFDFNVELTTFSELCRPLPSKEIGFYQMKLPSDVVDVPEQFQEFISNDRFLLTDSIKVKYEELVTNVLHDAEFWRDEPVFEPIGESTDDHKMPPYDPCQHCTTLKLVTNRKLGPQSTDYSRDTLTSIDIVPCIHFDGLWPSEAIHQFSNFDATAADTVSRYGCSFTLAQPNKVYKTAEYSPTSARVSFSFAESRLLKSCSAEVKAAYMVAKWLIDEGNEFQLTSTEDASFTSHSLKTAVFMCIAEDDESQIASKQDLIDLDLDYGKLADWVRKIFRRLLTFSSTDSMPTFFMSAPTFDLPVWNFEKYLNYAHDRLKRCGCDYHRLFKSNYHSYSIFGEIQRSFAMSHLLYWSVLEEGADIFVEFPNISANNT